MPVEVEKIVEVERKVEVPKEVVVTREVEVPGPERVITVEATETVKRLNNELLNLQAQLKQEQQKEPEVVEVEKAATGDLKEAAHLMAISELNKEDLTEEQILEMLQKSSDEEVKRKLGFWAVQLPKADQEKEPTNKKYIGKK